MREGPFGARTFEIHGVRLAGGDWLTVALHPDPVAVQVRVVPPQAIEVCPASVDGDIGPPRSSWPSWFHFDACEPLETSGIATLPSTDGNDHVAFGIRAVRPDVTTAIDVSVSYHAEDSFVLVIPPAVGTAHAEVTFVAHTATVGVQTFAMPGFATTSMVAAIEQQKRRLHRAVACDFGSEVGCVRLREPNRPVQVIVGGPSSDTARLAVYISWA